MSQNLDHRIYLLWACLWCVRLAWLLRKIKALFIEGQAVATFCLTYVDYLGIGHKLDIWWQVSSWALQYCTLLACWNTLSITHMFCLSWSISLLLALVYQREVYKLIRIYLQLRPHTGPHAVQVNLSGADVMDSCVPKSILTYENPALKWCQATFVL
jgi:hypothetical protein